MGVEERRARQREKKREETKKKGQRLEPELTYKTKVFLRKSDIKF